MTLTSYLFADGKAAEMLAFYHAALGGELESIPFLGSPAAEGMPEDWLAGKVLWGAVHSPLGDLCVMDTPPGRAGASGSNFAIQVECADHARLAEIFAKLCEGGEVMMPMEKTFWSPMFAMVEDRYKTRWMLTAGRSM